MIIHTSSYSTCHSITPWYVPHVFTDKSIKVWNSFSLEIVFPRKTYNNIWSHKLGAKKKRHHGVNIRHHNIGTCILFITSWSVNIVLIRYVYQYNIQHCLEIKNSSTQQYLFLYSFMFNYFLFRTHISYIHLYINI